MPTPIPQEVETGIVPPKQIDFFEALKSVADGKSITKLEWKNENIIGLMHDGRLTILLEDKKLHDWIISDGDMAGTDYIVL